MTKFESSPLVPGPQDVADPLPTSVPFLTAQTANCQDASGISPSSFFENTEIGQLIKRALFYVRAGVPVHFQGAAGRGKTALATEVARRLGRRTVFMSGHEWLDAQDLVGKMVGQTEHAVVDKYVQRVRRSETRTRHDWEDSLLAKAMREGHTLVYDEFTRATARANGLLLSVLEERVLPCTDRLAPQDLIRAHPDFRIILTSNPHEYAGVNLTPDALLDRMLTFQLAAYSPQTEAGIVATRTGLPDPLPLRIVRMVKHFSREGQDPAYSSMRAALLIAQIAAARLRSGTISDGLLAQICVDVLNGRGMALNTPQVTDYLAQDAGPPQEAQP